MQISTFIFRFFKSQRFKICQIQIDSLFSFASLFPSHTAVAPGWWVQFPVNLNAVSKCFLLFVRLWYCPVDAEEPEHWRPRSVTFEIILSSETPSVFPEIAYRQSHGKLVKQIIKTVCHYSIRRRGDGGKYTAWGGNQTLPFISTEPHWFQLDLFLAQYDFHVLHSNRCVLAGFSHRSEQTLLQQCYLGHIIKMFQKSYLFIVHGMFDIQLLF